MRSPPDLAKVGRVCARAAGPRNDKNGEVLPWERVFLPKQDVAAFIISVMPAATKLRDGGNRMVNENTLFVVMALIVSTISFQGNLATAFDRMSFSRKTLDAETVTRLLETDLCGCSPDVRLTGGRVGPQDPFLAVVLDADPDAPVAGRYPIDRSVAGGD